VQERLELPGWQVVFHSGLQISHLLLDLKHSLVGVSKITEAFVTAQDLPTFQIILNVG
jgi:hypothetical protein